MTIQQAETFLKQFENCLVKSIYDSVEGASKAILTLKPDFEYPDWSHRKVSELIEYYSCKLNKEKYSRISQHENRLHALLQAEKHAWGLNRTTTRRQWSAPSLICFSSVTNTAWIYGSSSGTANQYTRTSERAP